VLVANAEVNPGLRSTVSNAGIEYAKNVLQPRLIQEVKTAKLPDFSGSGHHAKVDLSQFHIEEFGIAKSSIVVSSPNVGTVSISGISLRLSFHWHYKYRHLVSDHGSADVHTSGASTKVSAHIGRDANGAPTVTVSDTGFDVGDLSIKLHGGASWLYNLIISNFKGRIRSAINKEVRAKMSSTIGTLVKEALASVPLSHDFGHGVSLCYALADQPSVISDFGGRMVVGSVAEFYATKEGRGKSPFKPTGMPKTLAKSAPGPMVELFMNEYFFNTFSWAFIHAGNLHMQIDQNSAPDQYKALFTTGHYASAAPGLVQKYGKDSLIRLDFDVTQVPTLYFQPDGFQLKTSAMLTLEVKQGDKYVKVIGLTLTLLSSGSISIKGTSVYGHLKTFKVTATVSSSIIGEVNVTLLQDLLNFVGSFVTGVVNKMLAPGVPLPVVKGVSFVDPKIIWGTNYVAITSSFQYKP